MPDQSIPWLLIWSNRTHKMFAEYCTTHNYIAAQQLRVYRTINAKSLQHTITIYTLASWGEINVLTWKNRSTRSKNRLVNLSVSTPSPCVTGHYFGYVRHGDIVPCNSHTLRCKYSIVIIGPYAEFEFTVIEYLIETVIIFSIITLWDFKVLEFRSREDSKEMGWGHAHDLWTLLPICGLNATALNNWWRS